MIRSLATLALVIGLLGGGAKARAEPLFPRKDLGQFYDRIAEDLRAGRPLTVTIYIALCDNDSQGIVKVKNRRICRGDDPDHNLYWATAGGLSATLDRDRWQRVQRRYRPESDLAVEAIWRKSFQPGGVLRARGVTRPFDVYLLARGYRGDHIATAMLDYLVAVNRDGELTLKVGDADAKFGGASHVVGYIGHDYFYDVGDPAELLGQNRGDSKLHKGTFALACTGHRFIRPAIRRANAHIFILNRTLGFPGAWTVLGILDALARGASMKDIHHSAAAAFAAGQGISLGTARGRFAYGD
jgi:hypothetical protein